MNTKLIFLIFLSIQIITGCGNKNKEAKADEDDFILNNSKAVLEAKIGVALCDRYEGFKITNSVITTAGKIKYPAYIVSFKFRCLSAIRDEWFDGVVGFVSNTDSNRLICLDASVNFKGGIKYTIDYLLKDDSWVYQCGGLNL